MKIDKVAILVKKAALKFDKISNPVLAEYDLSASQYKILKYLYSRPERTARVVDLGRQYSMTHPTVIGLLDNLEKKGFITRTTNSDDAREKRIALTEKADSMQSELEALGDALEAKFTEHLTGKETARLVSLLQKLLDEA